jgi:hypothetical protein
VGYCKVWECFTLQRRFSTIHCTGSVEKLDGNPNKCAKNAIKPILTLRLCNTWNDKDLSLGPQTLFYEILDQLRMVILSDIVLTEALRLCY